MKHPKHVIKSLLFVFLHDAEILNFCHISAICHHFLMETLGNGNVLVMLLWFGFLECVNY